MPNISSIPGIQNLWQKTMGDSGICIAVLDGRADLNHPCFEGADLERLESPWLENDETEQDEFPLHATHIASVIFGQHGSEVEGIAPKCRGLNITTATTQKNFLDPLSLARAVDTAAEAGANIIHIATCLPSKSGKSNDMLERSIRGCIDRNILVVAPAGNNHGECYCLPSAIPGVLAVGSLTDDGVPSKFNNWGGILDSQRVLAPGENMLGAKAGGGSFREKGTSCAAPVVTAVAALLMSLQLKNGQKPDSQRVRAALLNSALPCDDTAAEQRDNCQVGKLDIAGAEKLLFTNVAPSAAVTPSVEVSEIQPAAKLPSRGTIVYFLGKLSYDFGTEVRRDTFQRLMSAEEFSPANPYDTRQMVRYLAEHPSESKSLIWTLGLGLTPIYAIRPIGPFGADLYQRLADLLDAQSQEATSPDYIERASFPGFLTGRTVSLLSDESVSELVLENTRGVYGWQTARLVNDALQMVRLSTRNGGATVDENLLRRNLLGFLNRLYHDLQNYGATSSERALNFAGTNIIQAMQVFVAASADGKELDTIQVEKSHNCRLASDCWDIKLEFFDPDNRRRANSVFRFTIDVRDIMPVTLGTVASWPQQS